GTFADPQWTRTSLQHSGVEVPLGTREMVMPLRLGHLLCSPHRPAVQVHQVIIRRRMRKDRAATTPVTSSMRPGARRCIAHAVLLRQGEGNAPLLQVYCPATAGQGG